MAKKIILQRDGNAGWGGPLEVVIEPGKKILSMTGRGIETFTQELADKMGVEVVDGFKEALSDDQVLLAIVSCGGTLRCGVYPQKGIKTINLNFIGPSGPLKDYINENNYISGVSIEKSIVVEDDEPLPVEKNTIQENLKEKKPNTVSQQNAQKDSFFIRFVGNVGIALGKVISMAFESAKESVDIVIHTVLPFMIFISVLVTLILSTGIGNAMAQWISPLSGSIWGLLLISIICGIPFLSPLLGPGAAIAQVVGVLIGTQIAAGAIPPQFALPALFAINVQVGADFVPVGLSMQQAEPDTIKYGTPAFLISRQITGPIAVILAYLLSFGLF
mgnify:CR=1 FL=1